MDEQNRMEELARKILEKPAGEWPGDLGALQVELRPMPSGLRAKLHEFSRPEVPSAKPVARTIGRWKRVAGFSIGGAIAAGIMAYVGVSLQKAPESRRATIVFLTGSADLDGKSLATGDVLSEGSTLSISSDSLAVVGVSGGTEIRLRLRGPAQIGLETLGAEQFDARLRRGTVLANVRRLGEQNKTRAPFSVSTDTAIAGVRGTVFSTELAANGDTTLSTYEGTVAFRRRWPALEELPEELITKMELLSRSRQVLIDASASVGADSESSVSAQDFETRIGQVRDLQLALSESPVAKLRGRKNATEDEINAALASLNSRFSTAEARSSALVLVRDAFGQPPEVRPVPSEDMRQRREALEAADTKERDARFAELLANKSNTDKAAFEREATRVLGKAPQQIKLKNGETIYGSVFGLNDLYRIYTPTGIRDVSPDDVEEIQF